MKDTKTIYLSEKQYETLELFFSWDYIELLYGGWARWGKSYIIWTLLAICIAAFPWSNWLISRTVLSELQATTLTTFFQVLKSFGYWPKSYKDKIRDKKRIEFDNGSNIYVIQVGREPSDPEYDRLGSYSYTGAFLDEGQQMGPKVRSVLAGRFSDTKGSFNFEIPKKQVPEWTDLKTIKLWYDLNIGIVAETADDEDDFETKKEDIQEVKLIWGRLCAITHYKKLYIPYRVMDLADAWQNWLATVGWDFKPTTLISCNPWKNFTYTEFYKPYSKWLAEWDEFKYLTKTTSDWTILRRKFIQSLVKDNPWVPKSYAYWLETSNDEVSKQRLLYGNFEYDDDPTLLFDNRMIANLYDAPRDTWETYYITVDAARKGKDKCVVYLWQWLNVIEVYELDEPDLVKQKKTIEELKNKYNVNISNIIIDEVWVWGWLVDMLGCKWFIANASSINPYSAKLLEFKKRNYANLRTQAFYYLQQYIIEDKIRIKAHPWLQETINEELLFIKQKDVDWDRKIALESKQALKNNLGRSPDYADALSFRMRRIIKNHAEGNIDESEEKEAKDEHLIDLLEEEELQELDAQSDIQLDPYD